MKKTVGFAVTGSHCTFPRLKSALEELCGEFDVIPILSREASTDSRFMGAGELTRMLGSVTGRTPVATVGEAEPIGPKKLLDLLVICPCTGNTAAKIALGITDGPVTMAFKAHVRNSRPVLLSVFTNDGLGANAQNIGRLMNTKNVFFVPFGQDDPENKPCSLTADLTKLVPAAKMALESKQLQPVVVSF